MDKYQVEFTHELKFPLTYALNGESVEAKNITVKAPNNLVSSLVSIIESEMNRAVFEVSLKVNKADAPKEDEKTENETEENKINSVYMMLSAYGDMNKCLVAFKSIMTFERGGKATALVDGLTKMTSPIYDDLSLPDTKELLIKYILNFLNTSLNA